MMRVTEYIEIHALLMFSIQQCRLLQHHSFFPRTMTSRLFRISESPIYRPNIENCTGQRSTYTKLNAQSIRPNKPHTHTHTSTQVHR